MDDNQDNELSKLVSAIDNDVGQGLQDVFDEAQEHNAHTAVIIKQAWDLDVLRLKEQKHSLMLINNTMVREHKQVLYHIAGNLVGN